MDNVLTFAAYQGLAHKTSAAAHHTKNATLSMAALGLAGESGEVADIMKKVLFHGHTLDIHALAIELGDVLWYIAEMCTVNGLSLNNVAELNIQKLRERYPEGFSTERSIHRAPVEGYNE